MLKLRAEEKLGYHEIPSTRQVDAREEETDFRSGDENDGVEPHQRDSGREPGQNDQPEVSAPCLIKWPDEPVPKMQLAVDGFDIALRLLPAEHWGIQDKDDLNWTTGLQAIELEVSRNETDSPPEVIITPNGTRDLTVQSSYLYKRLPAYRSVALEISNRLLCFFQYTLNTPLIRSIPTWEQALHNPTWYDSSGSELRGGTRTVVAEPVPGIRGELGVRKLTPCEAPALVEYLKQPQEPSLAQTLLSDAQTAWFEGNLRRAVLELAICTEVMVKRRFFTKASPAGAAFDYLEDKAKVSVRVLELLDAVAEEAFFRSFRKEAATSFARIDHMFRCRNKIAHRGELAFRDDSGTAIQVDATRVESWWVAVEHLKRWLDALS